MSKKAITGDCLECESTYEIQYATELTSQELPECCPFCGSKIEDISEEYIDEEELPDDDQWD